MAFDIHLRPLRIDDEMAATSAHEQLAEDGFTFLLGRGDPPLPWNDYVHVLAERACGRDVVPNWVPSTFLVATVDGEIVGRSSIRHRLNDYLSVVGGHIGFGVVPAFRKQGVATEILRQSLVIVRSLGVDRALVTCDDENIASARTIERCGGVLESTVVDPNEDRLARRYWIN
jgi:predicted acetyltransferase